MNHADHVRLLQPGVPGPGGVWADLGSGSGAFTLALADLIGPAGEIYAIDKDRRVLQELTRLFHSRFPTYPANALVTLEADFTRRLNLPALDGIVMANSLHFYRDKQAILSLVKSYLRPGGRFLLVEYNVDQGNMWVPYPLSFHTWVELAKRAGFSQSQWLASVPSRFLKEIYSAVSW
ncbi:MAG: class I SAM-dependent methyltransferase [Omnitrophica WOR_2 bacterium]